MAARVRGVEMTAELARLIRERALSPVDVMEATLRRIEERNPRLNAFVHLAFDEAMDAGRAAERDYTLPISCDRQLPLRSHEEPVGRHAQRGRLLRRPGAASTASSSRGAAYRRSSALAGHDARDPCSARDEVDFTAALGRARRAG